MLLTGRDCGIATPTLNATIYENGYRFWKVNLLQQLLSYVRECYQPFPLSEKCGFYVKPRLQYKADRNASCPFSDEICLLSTGNLKIHTDPIDSHDHLGLNAIPQERFTLQFMYHCAPLKTEGFSGVYYVKESTKSDDEPPVPLFRLLYGNQSDGSLEEPISVNYTYQLPVNVSLSDLEEHRTLGSPVPDYCLGYVFTSYN